MLEVRKLPVPLPGSGSGKVDARSERWREHRKKVRTEIVDAAFRAIDRSGPEVSLQEIAAEAGTPISIPIPKPKSEGIHAAVFGQTVRNA